MERHTIGRYELVARIGAGGMGEVWEAVLHGPHGFRKPVALKLVREVVDGGRRLRALVSEARVGAALSHPNVVGVHELGEVEGQLFVAMELVRGASLHELLSGGALAGPAVLDAAIQACAGLAHIHETRLEPLPDEPEGEDEPVPDPTGDDTWATAAGARSPMAGPVPTNLVHRDVKPANLLLDRSGLVKVADLGLAALHGGRGGTPGYLPPEQLDGGGDARADLFALGVTLAELATGVHPFGSGALGLRMSREAEQRFEDPAFVGRLEACTPGLAEIVRRCLRIDPDRRWASAHELGAALRLLRRHAGEGESLTDRLARLRPEHATRSVPTSTTWTAGNLPAARDRFVGRQDELAEVLGRLRAGERLVTLHGPGGMGKTRLGLEVARTLRAEVSGGAWFCDLSEQTTALGVVTATAQALGVPLHDADGSRRLLEALRGRGQLLLVADNLEQVQARVGPVVGSWLEAAPELRLIATSRIPLGIAGERVVPLGPLAPSAAEALFVERASRRPSEAERPLIHELVTALDGLPLAIELAAARTRALSVRAILDRLRTHHLELAAPPGSDRPDRHRSLRASLQGSWDLLDPWARRALSRATVFAGTFSLDAAQAVLDLGPAAPWVVELVERLVDHALVRVVPETGRYRVLAAVAAWAGEHCTAEDRDEAERRHGQAMALLGSPGLLDALDGPHGRDAFRALAEDLDNLALACRRAVARRDAVVASAAARAAWHVYIRVGPFDVGLELLEAAADVADPPDPRLFGFLGVALRRRGRLAEAEDRLLAALAAWERAGDVHGQAIVCCNLGNLYSALGRPDLDRRYMAEALRHARAAGDPRLEALAATMLAETTSDHDEARALISAGIEISARLGDTRQEALGLSALAGHDYATSRYAEAVAHLERASALARELGDLDHLATFERQLAEIAAETGDWAKAADAFGRVIQWRRELGDPAGLADALAGLAIARLQGGRGPEARASLHEAIPLFRAHRPAGLVHALVTLARVELADGRPEAARAAAEEAHASPLANEEQRSSASSVLERLSQ